MYGGFLPLRIGSMFDLGLNWRLANLPLPAGPDGRAKSNERSTDNWYCLRGHAKSLKITQWAASGIFNDVYLFWKEESWRSKP
jgi:hypothetical protein